MLADDIFIGSHGDFVPLCMPKWGQHYVDITTEIIIYREP